MKMAPKRGIGAQADGPNDPEYQDPRQPVKSLPAKIANSASGLLSDALSPRGSQPGAALSQALANGGKGHSSSSAAAYDATDMRRLTAIASLSASKTSDDGPASFRSGTIPSAGSTDIFNGMTLDEFLLLDPRGEDYFLDADTTPDKGKGVSGRTVDADCAGNKNDSSISSSWRPTPSMVLPLPAQSGSKVDGEEVVQLLSSSELQPDTWVEDDVERDLPFSISDEELRLSRWFVDNFPAISLGRDRFDDAIQAAKEGHPFQEFASFFDEIENYQDEVWGYLRPLVEAAKEESRQTRSATANEGPAVRRLRMILAHLDT